jgi:hypothetical protein
MRSINSLKVAKTEHRSLQDFPEIAAFHSRMRGQKWLEPSSDLNSYSNSQPNLGLRQGPLGEEMGEAGVRSAVVQPKEVLGWAD